VADLFKREKVKILVVEDSRSLRFLLTHLLEQHGYDVDAAENGSKGLEKYRQGEYDLILSDIMMPEMNGIEMCEHIKGDPKEGSVFFIFLSTLKDLEDRIKGIETGADDYLVKPFDNRELMAKINAGARIIKLQRQLEEKNRELTYLNDLLSEELEAAMQIHLSLFPRQISNLPGAKVEARFKPMPYLGGDFYEVLTINQDLVAIFTADVSGHGFAATYIGNILRQIFREHYSQLVSPAQLMTRINQQFKQSITTFDFATAFYGILDSKSNLFHYVRAGAPIVPVIKSLKEDLIFLEDNNPAIGAISMTEYQEQTIQLSPGDIVFLYSDGVTETKSPDDQFFGEERLFKILQDTKIKGVKEKIQAVMTEVDRFKGNCPFSDDITLLGLEIYDQD